MGQFDKRRTTAYERLQAMEGVSCVEPRGAFYLFPNISGTGLKSGEFCDRLLQEKQVAMVPGVAFGSDDCLRLSYATSLENIEKGLDRMADFVQGLS